MSADFSFVERMRRKTGRAKVRSLCYQTLFALGLAVYGFYFPSFCSDCAEHPILKYLVAAGAIAGAAFWIRHIVRSARSANPVDLQLGSLGDPAEIATQLDHDFAGQRFRGKRLYISPRWLSYARGKEVIVRPVETLVWAHLEKVRTRFQGLIPIWTTHQLVVWDRAGAGAVFILGKKRSEEAIASLQTIAPWMFFGYTNALKESWNNDRDDFIAYVDQRRSQSS